MMDSYQYTPLPDPNVDIRVVDISPGNFADDIYLDVLHVPLHRRPQHRPGNNDGRLTLRQLRETVPPGWLVRVTTEGRYMFNREGSTQSKCWQWEHPDPNFDRAKYELASDPDLDDQSPAITPIDDADMSMPPPPLKYEALSYTWNSGVGEDERIFVAGPSPLASHARLPPPPALPPSPPPSPGFKPPRAARHGTMWVGQSLAIALRHLRRPDRPRRVWIDAICINQEDDSEKGCQVGRMADIFRSAHRVVGFLGPEADDSGHALRTMHHLGRQLEVLVPSLRVCSPDARHRDWVDRETELPYDAATWHAIHALLGRKWFTRLWIIQESRLAGARAVVQAGADAIPLSIFRRAVKCLRGKHSLPLAELRDKLEYVQRMTDDQGDLPFCAVLDMGYGRGCANPRDRVYGLLGMAPPRLATKLRPQYSRQVAEVMRDTMLTHMRHCQRLELLKRCYQVGRKVEGLPSWVPDLTSGAIFNLTRASDFAAGYSRAYFWHRPGPPPATAAIRQGRQGQHERREQQQQQQPPTPSSTAHDVLEVLGIRCAVVTAVSSPLLPEDGSPAEMIRSWQPANVRTSTYAPTGQSLEMAHAITLRKNIFSDRYPSFRCTDEAQWLRDNTGEVGLMPAVVPAPTPTSEGEGNEADADVTTGSRAPPPDSHVYGRAIKLCMGKTYVQTREGYIGLAPADAKPGDIIVVLLGCDSPILLRPTGAEASYYIVMGECFVYGLHDAIALLGPLPAPWRVQFGIGHGNRLSCRFVNLDTGASTHEDPRLAAVPLGSAWTRCRTKAEAREADDPETFDYFRNTETGEVINSDPRMAPEALAARGLDLVRFALI